MSNALVAVQTFNPSMLALLSNLDPWITTANKKYVDFARKEPKNLGDTVLLQIPTRMTAQSGLVLGAAQGVAQRSLTLSVQQSNNVYYGFTDQERIFNLSDEEYMDEFGRSAVEELGTQVALYVSSMAVQHTYRTFGDGITPINSFDQLAQALANFRNFGSPAKAMCKVYLPDVIVPSIIGSGLNQFAPSRNNEIANSWQLGNFSNAEFYSTNILTTQVAGDVGNEDRVLTLTGVSEDGTQLTFDDPSATDSNAIAAGDIITLDYNNQFGLRFLTFTGHIPCKQYVQVRATAAAATSSNTLVVDVFPALIYDATNTDPNRNINLDISDTSGIECKVLPSHVAALITCGDPLFLAMPRLPDEDPYKTATEYDPDSGCSLRTYYGSLFGQNFRGIVHDVLYDAIMQDEYAMRIAIPL